MLKEMSSGKQPQPRRRWFTDEEFDLIVWFSGQGRPEGFQLCYDRNGHERALTWTEDAGYRHDRIDDGEGNPTKNRSPILVSDGVFPAAEVLRRFEASSSGIASHIRQFVAQKLREYTTNAGKAEQAHGSVRLERHSNWQASVRRPLMRTAFGVNSMARSKIARILFCSAIFGALLLVLCRGDLFMIGHNRTLLGVLVGWGFFGLWYRSAFSTSVPASGS